MNHNKPEEKTNDKSLAVGLAIAAMLNLFLGLLLFGENELGLVMVVTIGLLVVAVVTVLKGNHSAK